MYVQILTLNMLVSGFQLFEFLHLCTVDVNLSSPGNIHSSRLEDFTDKYFSYFSTKIYVVGAHQNHLFFSIEESTLSGTIDTCIFLYLQGNVQ